MVLGMVTKGMLCCAVKLWCWVPIWRQRVYLGERLRVGELRELQGWGWEARVCVCACVRVCSGVPLRLYIYIVIIIYYILYIIIYIVPLRVVRETRHLGSADPIGEP